MIIQCTACEKKFSVPDSAITADGRLVQCSSCGNKWTQFPLKIKEITDSPITKNKPVSKNKIVSVKRLKKKKKGPMPYSKEYMKEKWGTSIQNYTVDKGISKKSKKLPGKQKNQKQKYDKSLEKTGFGFFNYIITFGVFSVFFIGILNFERNRISRKFPFLEPYIDHFFETLDNFKIFIFDLL